MATLKDHQQAMVDLLASGSGIPASASRLAHAMHDLIGVLYVAFPNLPRTKDEDWLKASRETRLTITPDVTLDIKDLIRAVEANSPGLNDKALAADVEACRPKVTPVERRVKELENTVNRLRTNNAKLRAEIQWLNAEKKADEPEQAGVRKDDTQLPDCWHKWVMTPLGDYEVCAKCGITPLDAFGPNKKVPLK